MTTKLLGKRVRGGRSWQTHRHGTEKVRKKFHCKSCAGQVSVQGRQKIDVHEIDGTCDAT